MGTTMVNGAAEDLGMRRPRFEPAQHTVEVESP
jgi:hypothetical protein